MILKVNQTSSGTWFLWCNKRLNICAIINSRGCFSGNGNLKSEIAEYRIGSIVYPPTISLFLYYTIIFLMQQEIKLWAKRINKYFLFFLTFNFQDVTNYRDDNCYKREVHIGLVIILAYWGRHSQGFPVGKLLYLKHSIIDFINKPFYTKRIYPKDRGVCIGQVQR